MERRGEMVEGEGDPRETTECKQVVEEEVRRRDGVLVLCGVRRYKEVRPCLQAKSGRTRKKEHGQHSSIKQVHYKNRTSL